MPSTMKENTIDPFPKCQQNGDGFVNIYTHIYIYNPTFFFGELQNTRTIQQSLGLEVTDN